MDRREFFKLAVAAAPVLIVGNIPAQDAQKQSGCIAWRADQETGEMVATMADGSEKRVKLLGALSREQSEFKARLAAGAISRGQVWHE